MNNSFLEQIAKTSDLNSDLIMRQQKLDKMAKFMKTKSISTTLQQFEIARELKIASSTLKGCTRQINLFLPHGKSPSTNTHTNKTKDFKPH